MKRRWIPILVVFALATLPKAAFACSVCFDPRDKNRAAFVITTVLLTFFPLAVVGGAGVWLRKRFHRIEVEDERDALPRVD
jgi:hypothetical protein